MNGDDPDRTPERKCARPVTPENPLVVEGEHAVTVKCNCRKTKCIKLYCDCFRINKLCENCNCTDCSNAGDKEQERLSAITGILERNPEAFAPRIKEDPSSNAKGHLSGCHCKKSACLKKYCECYSAGVPCSDKCRCLDCKNPPDGADPENPEGSSGGVSVGVGMGMGGVLNVNGKGRSGDALVSPSPKYGERYRKSGKFATAPLHLHHTHGMQDMGNHHDSSHDDHISFSPDADNDHLGLGLGLGLGSPMSAHKGHSEGGDHNLLDEEDLALGLN